MIQTQVLKRIKRSHWMALERQLKRAYSEGVEEGRARARGAGRRGRTIRGDATVDGLLRLGTSHYPDIEGREAVRAFLDATAGFIDDLDSCVRAELAPEPRPLEHFWRAADAVVGPFPEMAVELARSVGAHLDLAVEEGLAERRDGGERSVWLL